MGYQIKWSCFLTRKRAVRGGKVIVSKPPYWPSKRYQWISTVECIDMKWSSQRAWSTINKLTGHKHISSNPNSISPNAVASCLLNNGKFKNPNRQFTREVNRQLKEEWNSPSANQNLCEQFTDDEIIAAIKLLKAGKAPGADNLHPEFFLHIHENGIQWLRWFFTVCLHTKETTKCRKQLQTS